MSARSADRWLVVACVCALAALALMTWQIFDPTVWPVMVAMSLGQVLGTASFGRIRVRRRRRLPSAATKRHRLRSGQRGVNRRAFGEMRNANGQGHDRDAGSLAHAMQPAGSRRRAWNRHEACPVHGMHLACVDATMSKRFAAFALIPAVLFAGALVLYGVGADPRRHRRNLSRVPSPLGAPVGGDAAAGER